MTDTAKELGQDLLGIPDSLLAVPVCSDCQMKHPRCRSDVEPYLLHTAGLGCVRWLLRTQRRDGWLAVVGSPLQPVMKRRLTTEGRLQQRPLTQADNDERLRQRDHCVPDAAFCRHASLNWA